MFPKMFKIASVASLTSLAAVGSAFAVDLEFYFPVAGGGAASDVRDATLAILNIFGNMIYLWV